MKITISIDDEMIKSLISTLKNYVKIEGEEEIFHEYDFSIRTYMGLHRSNIQTFQQIARMGAANLLRIRGFGITSLKEVKRKLEDRGLILAR